MDGGHPKAPLTSSKEIHHPPPMGLLSVAEHLPRYSQNMLLTEGFIYTEHKKRSPERSSHDEPPAFAKIVLGLDSLGHKLLNTVV